MEQKWMLLDMHTHSEYSKINKTGDKSKVKKMSAKEFVDILRSHGVEIFSITDHNYFSAKYYNEIDSYISANSINMKLINGVELDVYVTLKKDEKNEKDIKVKESDETGEVKENMIHVCFYFDDCLNREKLESTINSLYRDENGNLKKPHLKDILNALEDVDCKIIIIPHGDKSRGLFNNNLMDKLSKQENPKFYRYAMYKIFNAFDIRKNLDGKNLEFWSSNFCEHTKKFNYLLADKTKEEIVKIRDDITQKMKKNDIQLNDEEKIIYDYILKYGSYFAYFSFSDWHNAFPYEPEVNNFIFGSLDFAFESFEMATLDPMSRIIRTKDKKINITNSILKQVSFSVNGKNKVVNFSPGLNAVVGKRGSGKSLLLAVLKNLLKKDDPDGALEAYKNLKISDIKAIDRSGIEFSLGGLNSVSFLSQDKINEIFNDPTKAQEQISKYFLDIKGIDLKSLNNIIEIGEKIAKYDYNYKNLTSNILSLKKFEDYEYGKIENISETDFKYRFNNVIDDINDLINIIETANLDTKELIEEKNRLIVLKSKYLKLASLYNDWINDINQIVDEINSNKTNNEIAVRQNSNDIKNALNLINNNFTIQINLKKFKYLINKFEMNNPTVEINMKNKYLFVTYYEIADDIKDDVINSILKTIYRGTTLNDVDSYVKGISNKRLNASYFSVVDELKKFIKGDMFKPKKEFYQINNNDINYKDEITTMNDLKSQVEKGNLINLTNASPGTRSVAYLDMLFDLEDKILVLDQPEDNIDNDYISNFLVPNIKATKKIKQLIFVTHNPSVAVYGDAFNYIYVVNDGSDINYTNYIIENVEDKEKLINILEGGRPSFSNRNQKFGNILGEEEYGNK